MGYKTKIAQQNSEETNKPKQNTLFHLMLQVQF